MAKYCTLVLFSATYERGVEIDAMIAEEWEAAHNYWMLMEHLSDEESKHAFFDNLPGPERGRIDRMNNAYQGMTLRAQFNGHLKGPHIFHTDDKLTDAFLIDWAKHNVFKRRTDHA